MSIIKDWYNGIKIPCEHVPHNAEFRDMEKKIGKEREFFRSIIPEKDSKRFDDWFLLMLELETMQVFENYGFKQGIKLMDEVYEEAPTIPEGI